MLRVFGPFILALQSSDAVGDSSSGPIASYHPVVLRGIALLFLPLPAPTCTSFAVLEGAEFRNQISRLEKLGMLYNRNILQF